MKLNRDKLGKMMDEATELRDKELGHTREFIYELDQKKYGAFINLGNEQFYQLLQVMEQRPESYSDKLPAMKREAKRRSLVCK